MDVDLVSHDGGNVRGDFVYTLDAVDIATLWTETGSVKNRAQIWTVKELEEMEKRFPFPILELHPDNDSAFINAHIMKFCEERGIAFTRSRPGRRNDNCYVEQKNWSVVRKMVGYARRQRGRA